MATKINNFSKPLCIKFSSPLSQPQGMGGQLGVYSTYRIDTLLSQSQVIKSIIIQTFLGHLTGRQEPDIFLTLETPFLCRSAAHPPHLILLHVHSPRLHSWIFREALQTAATLILISTSPPPSGRRTWSWTQPGMEECGLRFTWGVVYNCQQW